MRCERDDVRDHIVCRKNDYEPSYALYGASERWKSPKIDFREIFGDDRFSTFAKQLAISRHRQLYRPKCSLQPEAGAGGGMGKSATGQRAFIASAMRAVSLL
jgi:hypothetical protein